jgi:Ca-activated chloride channel family protein
MKNAAATLRLLLERKALQTNESVSTHLVFEVDPTTHKLDEKRAPLSVVFVLDASSSMAGPPMHHVKDSVTRLISLMGEGDSVGVVAFADNVHTISPLESLNERSRRKIKHQVRGVEAGGWTNLSSGIDRARRIFGKRKPHERQVMVLLTDGQPNRGVSDITGLCEMVRGLRPDISTVPLGFGPHHADDLLLAMARAGGGDYFYVADPLEADEAFAQAVGAQGDVVADQVQLVLKSMPHSPGGKDLELNVEIDHFLGHQNHRFTRDGICIPLPDLFAGRKEFVVASLNLKAPREGGVHGLIDAELSFRPRHSSRREKVREVSWVEVFPDESGDLCPEARMRVLLAEAEVARDSARALADRGQFAGAASVVQRVLDALSISGLDDPLLNDAREQLVDEKMAYERHPAKEEYNQFKRMSMGITMQSGGWHHTERGVVTKAAREFMERSRGDVPRASFVVHSDKDGDEKVRVPVGGEFLVGRVGGNDLVLPRGNISKRHTRVVGRDGKHIVVDLKTTNGTFVNGQRIDAPRVLKPGDHIYVGDFTLVYEVES